MFLGEVLNILIPILSLTRKVQGNHWPFSDFPAFTVRATVVMISTFSLSVLALFPVCTASQPGVSVSYGTNPGFLRLLEIFFS